MTHRKFIARQKNPPCNGNTFFHAPKAKKSERCATCWDPPFRIRDIIADFFANRW